MKDKKIDALKEKVIDIKKNILLGSLEKDEMLLEFEKIFFLESVINYYLSEKEAG